METWIQITKLLQELGILPIIVLLFAIPGGLLLSLIGAKRFLFGGVGVMFHDGFQTWISDQKERTRVEVKLEGRLSDLTEQLKQLVSSDWDNRRYLDVVLGEVQHEHKEILAKLDQAILLLPRRKSDQLNGNSIEK